MNKPSRHSLPPRPSLEHLRKQARKRTKETPSLTLAAAQHQLAREYGFTNWAELARSVKAHSPAGTPAEQIEAAILRQDIPSLRKLLAAHPQLLTPALWPPAIFQAKSLAVTRLLLELGLNPDECSAPRKPLHLAVYQCLPDIVTLLISHQANVLLRNSLNETPLDLLDAYEPRPVGDPDASRIRAELIKAGAEDDLSSIIRAGDLALLRKLLSADPTLALSDSELGGPLFVAARSARVEIVRLLLKFGANPNQQNSQGNTPLWFAAQSAAAPAAHRIAVMEALLQAGAEINCRCEDGSTALAFAAWRGPVEVPRFLLAHGAFTWVEDDAGQLPKDYAQKGPATDKEEIIKLLSPVQITDPDFHAAVRAMEAGDLAAFRRLLQKHPHLATDRVPDEAWDSGNYFHRSTLLHFIAENPWRTRQLPANICALARILLDAGADVNAETAAIGNPHTTLDLVASSMPARVSRQQEALIDLLMANGATTDRAVEVALINDESAAAEYLLKKGAKLTLAAAAALGRKKELQKFLAAQAPAAPILERALSMALKYRRWNTTEVLLARGVDLDKEIVHAGTPLHHAALANYWEGCEKLLALGARLDLKDRLWNGTPAGWALHGGGHTGLSQWLEEQASHPKSGKSQEPEN